MPTAKDRMKRFLALADQGPSQRLALAEDLIDFLIDWPEDCARDMRRPVMALLDMTMQEADDFTRRRLAVRLGQIDDLPLALANRLFHCAPQNVRTEILRRNETVRNLPRPLAVRNPAQLLTVARRGLDETFLRHFAQAMHVSPDCVAEIVADDSGQSLAALCKGTGLGRGVYSALALMLFAGRAASAARLSAFEEIGRAAAENITAFWQQRGHQATAA